MLRVVCPNEHHTSKRGPSEWRHFRACGVCGAPTVVDYVTRCSHQGWRYPNELPVDGDLCPDCNHEHVEPIRFRSEAELEKLRGYAEWLAVGLEAEQDFYTAREANEAIRTICYAHRFPYSKRSTT